MDGATPYPADNLQVVRTCYRYRYPDGSVELRTTYKCPCCDDESEDLDSLCTHTQEAHGIKLPTTSSTPAEDVRAPEHADGFSPSQTPQGQPSAKVQVCRLHLPGGEVRLECPICGAHLPEDEAAFLAHTASSHGRALSTSGGKLGGESDSLDMLHQTSDEHWHPKREQVLRRMRVISLGGYCGVKFSIQRLGLGDAHLPFDWIRTTSEGIQNFMQSDFANFFCTSPRCDIPGENLRVYRSPQHSFWHDDIADDEVRTKLQRRVDRFAALANDPKDLLFVRACATTDEVVAVEILYQTLCEYLGASEDRKRRVLLAIVIDGQQAFRGPVRHTALPGVIFFLQPLPINATDPSSEAYCRAVTEAVDLALQSPDNSDAAAGFGEVRTGGDIGQSLTVHSGCALLGAVETARIHVQPCDAGLLSGYGDLTSFEAPGTACTDFGRVGLRTVLHDET